MRAPTLALLLVFAGHAAAARRQRAKVKPFDPPIGHVAEFKHAPKEYLGKGTKVVSVLTPGSGGRRLINPETRKFYGVQRREGMVTWVKKGKRMPFWGRNRRLPWKIRYVRMDPRGIAAKLTKEGQMDWRITSEKKGLRTRKILSVTKLEQPSWWEKTRDRLSNINFFRSGEEEYEDDEEYEEEEE